MSLCENMRYIPWNCAQEKKRKKHTPYRPYDDECKKATLNGFVHAHTRQIEMRDKKRVEKKNTNHQQKQQRRKRGDDCERGEKRRYTFSRFNKNACKIIQNVSE